MANMTPQEQLMLELINRARMDPAGEAKRFGIALNEGLRDEALSSAPVQVLAGNDKLAKAADNHSGWMIGTDNFAHYERVGTAGYTGYAPQDRMKAAGYDFTGRWLNGENIAYNSTTKPLTAEMQTQFTLQQHQNLFVDAGFPGRSHRLNILTPGFEEIGIGQKVGTFTLNKVDSNALMTTQNFATSATRVFVTGVVYNDKVVADDFFSVGEQVTGVAVSSSGAASVRTGGGGGYELLYLRAGGKIVDFSLSSGKISVGLTLGETNVKIDVVNGKEIWTNTSITSVSTNVTELHVLGIAKVDLNGAASSQKMFGNKAANILKGNNGNDTLIGKGGADSLDGGGGSDTASYEGASKGVTANLAKATDNTNDARGDTYVSIENLKGSSLADKLYGDSRNNYLTGGSGDDELKGNAGDDKLYGGAGADDLYGGSGKDVFVFKALSDSGTLITTRDTIFDFLAKEGDTIDLSAIDALPRTATNDPFSFIATKAFSGKAGELRYEAQGSDTYIYGDVTGDRKADFAIHLDDKIALSLSHFVL